MIDDLKKIKESLMELIPDPEIDFGPAYEFTHQRKREAIRLINKLINDQEPKEPKVSITVEMVRHLRDKSDHPMMECKKALYATNGDMSQAMEWLRTRHLHRTYL